MHDRRERKRAIEPSEPIGLGWNESFGRVCFVKKRSLITAVRKRMKGLVETSHRGVSDATMRTVRVCQKVNDVMKQGHATVLMAPTHHRRQGDATV